MTQSLFTNALRPRPDELFTPGSQNHRIYKRLLDGPTTNAEIVREMGIFNSTGRLSEVREAVRPFLMDVEARRIDKGLWQYQLRG